MLSLGHSTQAVLSINGMTWGRVRRGGSPPRRAGPVHTLTVAAPRHGQLHLRTHTPHVTTAVLQTNHKTNMGAKHAVCVFLPHLHFVYTH